MSRKREQQRENKKELARQLGVSGKVVPQNLLENERVTEPELRPSYVVVDVKRGFFQKAQPGLLSWRLYVKDPVGVRLVGHARANVRLDKGPVDLDVVVDEFDDEVRYRRPGAFVVAACVVEGGAFADDKFVVDAGAVNASIDAAGFVFAACAVVEVKAVDRVKTTLVLPLSTADQKLTSTLSLEVRL